MSLPTLRTSALRTRTPRAVVGARGYATPSSSLFSVQDANGVKIATSDTAAPTSAISLVIKAGSRYEPAPGVAHVLKNSLFKVRFRLASPVIKSCLLIISYG